MIVDRESSDLAAGRIVLVLGWVGLGPVTTGTGCASPTRLAANARRHEGAARLAAARGDYQTAAHEERAAEKDWSKADSRGRGWDVVSRSYEW